MNSSESTPNSSDAESNWLTGFLVVCFVPLVAFTPYLMMAAAYKTPNPEMWLRKDASITLLTAFTFTLFSLAYYAVREYKINTNKYIESLIDLREYQDKKYIDYMLAHYGNVSSIAAITAIITIAFRAAVTYIGISIPALVVSFGLVAIFLIYGLAFLKAAFGALNRGFLAFSALVVILVLDISVINLAIISIPGVR